MTRRRARSPLVALCLSLLVPGLGQTYNGEAKKGAAFLMGFWVFLPLGTVTMLLFRYGQVAAIAVGLSIPLSACVEGFLRARRSGSEFTPKVYNRWPVYLMLVLAHSLVISPLASSLMVPGIKEAISRGHWHIPTNAMAPTLIRGDYMVSDTRRSQNPGPARGDVVLFYGPEGRSPVWVKRVIALGGERVEIREGIVFINGTRMEDPWARHVFPPAVRTSDSLGPLSVPEDSVFLLGDNRDASRDSRAFGCIPTEAIIGRALFIIWSEDLRRIGRPVN